VSFGESGLCMVGRGLLRQGALRQAWWGETRLVESRIDMARQAGRGTLRFGPLRLVMARQARRALLRYGESRSGGLRFGRHGAAVHAKVRYAESSKGVSKF
jgi:hypothetical protein